MKRIFMRGGTGAITWTTVTGLAASLDPRTLEAPLLRADAHRSGGSLAVHFVKVPISARLGTTSSDQDVRRCWCRCCAIKSPCRQPIGYL